ncbi:uncharacterized protein LOC127836093 [Dreissena polymorpha]|uniref:PHD-type domain-containing protein n=1 Tax=Dreissena polymorpha TaxID=45954 RepID=A0A9D4JJ16_DREPO|nr:uncharacterized protein LOC127836093 [Dreissena polymorpha]XP_052218508.1 uncharacterized protein LOC127836093 [Dreissena polymorpha]KAH3814311.1 hypothetical protein DPMN_142807 [Dreissena polymorpha]
MECSQGKTSHENFECVRSGSDWSKGRYGRASGTSDNRKRKRATKQAFTPLTKSQQDQLKSPDAMRKMLYEHLKDDLPQTCFVLNIEKRRFQEAQHSLPPSVHEVVRGMKGSNSINMDILLSKLKLNEEQQGVLKAATTDQSSSQAWLEQRKGRITSSIFQRVASRVATLRKNEVAEPSALVCTILGEKAVKPSKAMKHGLSLEPIAKKAYEQIMKKTHKLFQSKNSGLTVCLERPYLAASADLEVLCKCCGSGLCEVKCPESIKATVPTVDNLDYLFTDEDGNTTLKKNHTYYFQIQGQMAILKQNYCDLFVFTHHGHIITRVMFDKCFWEQTVECLSWFWMNHVYPALIKDKKESENEACKPRSENETPCKPVGATPCKLDYENPLKTSNDVPSQTVQNVRRVLMAVQLPTQSKQKNQTRKRPIKIKEKETVFLCGVCGTDCLDEPTCAADESVGCDRCGVWVHYICAGVTSEKLALTDEWFCSKCSDK